MRCTCKTCQRACHIGDMDVIPNDPPVSPNDDRFVFKGSGEKRGDRALVAVRVLPSTEWVGHAGDAAVDAILRTKEADIFLCRNFRDAIGRNWIERMVLGDGHGS